MDKPRLKKAVCFKKRLCYIKYNSFLGLFIPSLMFCFLEKLFVFMLAHFLLTPFYNVPHTLTSFKNSN